MERVAKRYAKALFGLAAESDQLEKTESDLKLIEETIAGNPDLEKLLRNPLVSDQDKFKVLDEVFRKKLQITSVHFLNLLADKKRIDIIPEIIEAFQLMMLEFTNTVEAELISAVELSEKQIAKIQQNIEDLTGKTLRLDKRIDPDIIGGFVVKVEDIIIDNSMRNQLGKLRDSLVAR